MALLESVYQGLIAGLISIGKLALIILPLMVMVEFAKHYGWLERISKRSQWFTSVFHLPGNAALPALIGLFIGIVSGSGVILQVAKEENYSRATLTILFVLVGICHSLFEETALFIGLNANILVVAGARLMIALVFAYLIGWVVKRRYVGITSIGVSRPRSGEKEDYVEDINHKPRRRRSCVLAQDNSRTTLGYDRGGNK